MHEIMEYILIWNFENLAKYYDLNVDVNIRKKMFNLWL
jgi:hypothetical protein